MKHVLPIALALLVTSAAAETQRWTFTMTHLCSSETCLDLHGSFGGIDANGDQIITLDELSYLLVENYRFQPAWSSGPGQPPGGGSTSTFKYAIGGELSFSAGAAYYRVSVIIRTSEGYQLDGPILDAGFYAWTPETTVQVSTAVPEPGPVALWAPGLLGLAATLRRHRPRSLLRAS